MVTHIIIEIADIEESISNFDKLIKKGDFKEYYEGKKDALTYLLNHHVQGKLLYKQISLDEKDIEEKAAKVYQGEKLQYYGEKDKEREGYKQALKDLL